MPDEFSKRILIVDDDQGVRSSLARILRRLGHEIQLASDGYSAVEAARTFQPDLLVLDIRMPRMDGIETFVRIREEFPAIAAIFMTAFAASDQASAAVHRGAIRVMPKPLDVGKLTEVVDRSLRKAPVLIAEDDPTTLKSLTRALRAKHIEVETATSFREGIQLLRQRPDRAVVADVFLQDGLGHELLDATARSSDGDSSFILISGNRKWFEGEESVRLRERVIRMTKPLDLQQLIGCIDDLRPAPE